MVATPLSLRQWPLPNYLRSRGRSRMDFPTAIVSISPIGPTSSKYIIPSSPLKIELPSQNQLSYDPLASLDVLKLGTSEQGPKHIAEWLAIRNRNRRQGWRRSRASRGLQKILAELLLLVRSGAAEDDPIQAVDDLRQFFFICDLVGQPTRINPLIKFFPVEQLERLHDRDIVWPRGAAFVIRRRAAQRASQGRGSFIQV